MTFSISSMTNCYFKRILFSHTTSLVDFYIYCYHLFKKMANLVCIIHYKSKIFSSIILIILSLNFHHVSFDLEQKNLFKNSSFINKLKIGQI